MAPPMVKQSTACHVGQYPETLHQLIEREWRDQKQMPVYPGLENYQLLEKMGDGAFSVVYKARNLHVPYSAYDQDHQMNPEQPSPYVAIKVVNRRQIAPQQQASVLKEVAIMKRLNHKNIVQLVDFMETEDFYFIVLELVPGGELFHQIVRLTYFSENLSRHVIVQVAQAVYYLHEQAGVIHRDIKPENLLFYPSKFVSSKNKTIRKGEDANKEDEGEFIPCVGSGGIGMIKLADFGLSKIVWDAHTKTPCGTVGYTAPEIVKDESYSKSVDMWALGCVLYTLLCGFPPFYDESIEVLTEKVAKGQFTFLSPWWDEISDSAKDLVSSLLEVSPEKRLTIKQLFQHPWITQIGRVSTLKPTQVPQSISLSSPLVSEGFSCINRDAITPAAVTLKEVFDVSNAVQRMGVDKSGRVLPLDHANVSAGNRRRAYDGVDQATILENEEVGSHQPETYPVQSITQANPTYTNTGERGRARVAHHDITAQPRRDLKHRQSVREYELTTQSHQSFVFDLDMSCATLLEKRRRAIAAQRESPSSLDPSLSSQSAAAHMSAAQSNAAAVLS